MKPDIAQRRAGGKRRTRVAGLGARRKPARLRAAGEAGAVMRAPKVDLGGLDQFTGYVVRRAQVWIFQDFKRALKDLDVTPAQFSVLKIIAANPGIAQARVAEALSIERARLVQMLDRLEAPGLISRIRSAIDRRSHALHLTGEGARMLERLEERIEEHERNVVERLGAKGKSELLRLLGPFLL
ncbi:MAG: MarR family transcriptional regulator [Hyphomonadaceae bacterium]|nr:MarR family transcriptional regulator [Hyphomonadaceae bacterium]